MKNVTTTEKMQKQERANYTCDRCGNPSGPDEAQRMFEIREATIESSAYGNLKLKMAPDSDIALWVSHAKRVSFKKDEGEAYPETVSRQQKRIDCCTECFENVVIPALEALGFKAHVEELDY